MLAKQRRIAEKKKNEYIAEYNAFKKAKIKLLSKETRAFSQLNEALTEIAGSKKLFSDTEVPFRDFAKLKSSIPGDMFESEQSPIELNFDDYRFFLLPDVVLAFNKENEFITAFEPLVVIVDFHEMKRKIVAKKQGYENWTYNDKKIASDSILVSQGESCSRWLHERRSGGPDMRYSYNPMYEIRNDIYSFTEFSIQIGKYNAVYSASKGALSAKLKPKVREYCSISHKMNSIPSLLRLLEKTAKKKDAVISLSEDYESISKEIFFKEVGL